MTTIFCGTDPSSPKKKRRGVMQTLYSAIFGCDSTKKPAKSTSSAPVSVATVAIIASSVRPLHNVHIADNGVGQSPQQLPTSPTYAKTSYASADFGDKIFALDEDVITEEKEEGKDDESEYGSVEGEEEVGVKAEQIIGKFYQQIRMQALNSIGATRS